MYLSVESSMYRPMSGCGAGLFTVMTRLSSSTARINDYNWHFVLSNL